MTFNTKSKMIILASSLILLGACSKTEEKGEIVNESDSVVEVSDSSDEVVVASETDLKDDGYFKEIVKDGQHPKVKDTVSYDTGYSNTDWDKIKFDVDHIKIVNVDKFEDEKNDEYKQLISVKYKINNEDSSLKKIKPKEAVLLTDDGNEYEAKVFVDYLDDEIFTKNKHKDGYIHYKVKNENDLKTIKQINLSFTAEADGKEEEHIYHIELPIEPK